MQLLKTLFASDATYSEEPKCEEGERPTVPYLLFPTISFWIGIVLAEKLVFNELFSLEKTLLVSFSLLVIAAFLGIHFKSKIKNKGAYLELLISFLAILLGFICGYLFWFHLDTEISNLDATKTQEYSFTIISDPSKSMYGYSSYALCSGLNLSNAKVRIYWSDEEQIKEYGTSFESKVKLRALEKSEKTEFYYQKGICSTVTISNSNDVQTSSSLLGFVSRIRQKALDLIANYHDEGASIIAGALCGSKITMDERLVDDFQTTGLSHLIAVSGTHLALISSLLGWLIQKLKVSRAFRNVLIALFLAAYLVFSGFQDSALRSFAMTVVGLMAFLFKRRTDSGSSLAFVVPILLATSPEIAFSLGMQLSCASVFAIVLFSPLISIHVKSFLPTKLAGISEPLSLCLASQIVTIPFVVPIYSTLSLIAPLSNLVVAPLFGLFLPLSVCAVSLSLLFPSIASIVLAPLIAFGNAIADIIHALSDVPYAAIPFSISTEVLIALAVIFFVLLWLWWPSPNRKIIRFCTIFAVLIFVLTNFIGIKISYPSVVMLDVGQGDSLLIRDGNHAVLIDTGPDESKLLEELANQKVTHLDAVIITHPHDDHYGALEALKNRVVVDRIYISAGLEEVIASGAELESSTELMLDEISAFSSATFSQLDLGDSITFGHFNLVCESSAKDEFDWQDNNGSICMLLFYDSNLDGEAESKILFIGDAEEETLSVIDKRVGDIDVLKVGHHGSATSLSKEILAILKPEIACISVGLNNDYGHPTQEALAFLGTSKSQIFRTDVNGTVTLFFDAERIRISCENQS